MCAQDVGPRIRTERLLLRPPVLQDAVYVADLANDAEIARMTTGVPYPYRLADAEGFIAGMARSDPRQDRVLLIEHREFGPIGMAGFHRHGPSGLMELGYWLGRTFRGRGLATEAAAGALGWAHGPWGRRAIVSSHFADNPASARVLAKCGFLYTGAVEDRFSLGRGRTTPSRMMLRLA